MINARIDKDINSGSWVRKIFEVGVKLKSEGKEVCDFSLGNPILEPPQKLIEAMQKYSAEKGIHRYMSNAGYEEVRKKVANYLNENKLIDTSFDRIIMTSGAGAAINVVLRTMISQDDEVIIFSPYFMEYVFYIENFCGKAIFCKTKEDFSIDFNELQNKITNKTKAIILNSPNNPTGKIYSKEDLQKLSDLLLKQENKIYIISDEPYRDIIFDDLKYHSICSIYPYSFMVYSWSKSLNLAGERIGYLACTKDIDESIIKSLVVSFRVLGFVNAPSLMQKTIGDNLLPIKNIAEIYQKKRDFLINGLTKLGYSVFVPQGAFYLFVASPINDLEFCELAAKEQLLVTPGTGFGCPGYFRLAFCTDDVTIEKSLPLFEKLMKELKNKK